MIYTERDIIIKKDIAKIDAPVILYRGDRDVEIIFNIIDSKFKFKSTKANIIETSQASHGQLAISLPNDGVLITEITACQNGSIIFTITGDMINELNEVGFYSFHIRLYNDDMKSRITLPPIIDGIEIREPLVIEDEL